MNKDKVRQLVKELVEAAAVEGENFYWQSPVWAMEAVETGKPHDGSSTETYRRALWEELDLDNRISVDW